MTPELIAACRAIRRGPYGAERSAASVLSAARYELKRARMPAVEWDTGRADPRAEWIQDGFQIIADVVLDEYADTGDTINARFIADPRECRKYETARHRDPWGIGRHQLEWIAVSRDLDHKQAAAACSKLERIGAGESCIYGVKVRALRAGVELGSGSLWGIDAELPNGCIDYGYLEELARDMADEAISYARQKLEELRADPAEAIA